MADLYEPDYGTAFYRSKDPIKNLKIRVHLERVTSATIVPQAVLEQEADGEMEMNQLQLKQQFGGQKDSEEYTFKWQEKTFSQHEVSAYRDYALCDTVLARKYYEDTAPYRDGKRPTKRLFSYVDHDHFTNRDKNMRLMTTSPDEKPTLLAEKMSNLRQRKTTAARNRNDPSMIPKLNVVEYRPSEELIKKNHLLSTPVQTMYIMADLRGEKKEAEDAGEDDEFVLCTIKFDANGVISVCPDFNKGRTPYRIETSGLGRDVFEYTIEHASQPMSRNEYERELKMVRQLYNRHTEYLASLVGVEFEPLPPMESLRVVINGEIESAADFEYDNLYIQYFIDLPQHWYALSGQMSGITQICKTKETGKKHVAYFGFPFNFELLFKDDSVEKDPDTLPKMPMLYFEVLSLDSWERYRTEGYAYTALPTGPGRMKRTLHCWRPAGMSCATELRRFFIGGSPELEDPTYTALPSTFEGKHLCKFGFRTITTGNLTIQLNSMHQSQAFQHTSSSRKKVGNLLDRLGASSAQANIMSVLEAFQRAKQRMVAAREGLRKDFLDTVKANTYLEESD